MRGKDFSLYITGQFQYFYYLFYKILLNVGAYYYIMFEKLVLFVSMMCYTVFATTECCFDYKYLLRIHN